MKFKTLHKRWEIARLVERTAASEGGLSCTDTSVCISHFSSVFLQMSPSGKLRPDDALAQAKKLLPVEIRDRAIAAMEKCRAVAQGTRYCSLQQRQIPDF